MICTAKECMLTCPSVNLRQVSALEKMKIEYALFCIISFSDLGRSGPIFEFSSFRQKNITRWTFSIFFFENSSSKDTFCKNKNQFEFLVLSRNSRRTKKLMLIRGETFDSLTDHFTFIMCHLSNQIACFLRSETFDTRDVYKRGTLLRVKREVFFLSKRRLFIFHC